MATRTGTGWPRARRVRWSGIAKARDDGDALGCSHLGMALRDGIGTARDPAAAFKAFDRGCRHPYALTCSDAGTSSWMGRAARVEHDTLAHAKLVACLVTKIGQWEFPRPRRGGKAQVAAPIVLESQ